MLPIGPLMVEHRLIERIISLLKTELNRLESTKNIDPIFIEDAVDFFRTYADRTHHGKEEDILFKKLKYKKLKPEHEEIMDELVSEHRYARKTVGDLLEVKESYINGDSDAINSIIAKITALVKLYPSHIDKEDNHFFKPVMDYFSGEELDKMLSDFQEFDREMIHEKYEGLIKEYEKKIE